jgi:hypothetical protein
LPCGSNPAALGRSNARSLRPSTVAAAIASQARRLRSNEPR